MSYVAKLDTPLLRLSKGDRFTLRDACQGVHIFGGIGSGKTTGSGQALATAYLRAGMGGLVLCAKGDEKDRWLRYCYANRRLQSLIVFGDGDHWRFNFLTYELARQGMAGIGSVVECLLRVLEAARLSNPNASRGGEAFWEEATRQLLRNTLPVLYSALGTVSIPDIIRFVGSAPKSLAELQSAEWQDSAFMFQVLATARRQPRVRLHPSDFDKIASYWRDEFCGLDPKTRSNIAITLSTTLDRFNRGRLHDLFCTDTTVFPEMTFHGAVIVLDMPALTWNEDGIIAQQLFKYMWQRAVLSRTALEPKHQTRPVFLWADEAQYFVNSFDADYQSTCRSANACTVYLTQSLPTYYARMGGDNARHRADMLLANFTTRIFHNSADHETNRWAADMIGRTLQRRGTFSEGESNGYSQGVNAGENTSWGRNSGYSFSGDFRGGPGSWSVSGGSNRGGGENTGRNRGYNSGSSVSEGYSETMDYEIEPADFSRGLLTGGPANGGLVTGLWFQAGKRFARSGRNYLHVRFRQHAGRSSIFGA